jgi:hypothetical protein
MAPLGVMKRETVLDSVWASSGRLDLVGFELHGVAVGEPEFIAVDAQECFEFVIRTARHPFSSTAWDIIS